MWEPGPFDNLKLHNHMVNHPKRFLSVRIVIGGMNSELIIDDCDVPTFFHAPTNNPKYLIWRHPIRLVIFFIGLVSSHGCFFILVSSDGCFFIFVILFSSELYKQQTWVAPERAEDFRFRYFLSSSCVGCSQCIHRCLVCFKFDWVKYRYSSCWSCVFIPMELAPSSVSEDGKFRVRANRGISWNITSISLAPP